MKAKHGPLPRRDLLDAIRVAVARSGAVALTSPDRAHLCGTPDDGGLDAALRGEGAKENGVVSTADILLRQAIVPDISPDTLTMTSSRRPFL